MVKRKLKRHRVSRRKANNYRPYGVDYEKVKKTLFGYRTTYYHATIWASSQREMDEIFKKAHPGVTITSSM